MSASPESQNYLKILHLFNSTAPKFLRAYFLRFWNTFFAKEHGEWNNSPEFHTKFLAGVGSPFYGWHPKYQKVLKFGNIALWDFPLLADLLIYLHFYFAQLDKDKIYASRDTKSFPSAIILFKLFQGWETFKALEHPELSSFEFTKIWSSSEKVLVHRYGMEEKEFRAELDLSQIFIPAKEISDTESAQGAESLKVAGNSSFALKQYQEAITFYEAALGIIQFQSNPDLLAILYSNLSLCHTHLEHWDDAKICAKAAITLAPLWFKGYSRLALIHELRGKWSKALIFHEIASSLQGTPLLRNAKLAQMVTSSTLDLAKIASTRYHRWWEGVAHASEGDKHLAADDSDSALKSYMHALLLGNADGPYKLGSFCKSKNLGLEAFHQFKLASRMKDGIDLEIPDKVRVRNVGVAEAQKEIGGFILGNLEFGEDTSSGHSPEYGEDIQIVLDFYLKSLSNAHIPSLLNICLLLKLHPHLAPVEPYLKLGAYYNDPKTISLLISHYSATGREDFALKLKSVSDRGLLSLPLVRGAFAEDLRNSPEFAELLSLDSKYYSADDTAISRMLSNTKITPSAPPFLPEPKVLIISHRKCVGLMGQHLANVPPMMQAMCPTSLGEPQSQEGLTPITFKAMGTTPERDKTFLGRVLRVRVIEDITFGMSFRLLVKDEEDTVFPVYAMYPKRPTIHTELGFGCLLSLSNPNYRVMSDGMQTVVVNVPESIGWNVEKRNPSMCRYCWKEDDLKEVVTCGKCRRVSYCSQKCLEMDETEFCHNLVCVEKLYEFDVK